MESVSFWSPSVSEAVLLGHRATGHPTGTGHLRTICTSGIWGKTRNNVKYKLRLKAALQLADH